VYVLSDAVTKYGTGRSDSSAAADETPVPPCIKPRAEPAGCQIAVEIEDRADKASVLKVGVVRSTSLDQGRAGCMFWPLHSLRHKIGAPDLVNGIYHCLHNQISAHFKL